MADKQLGLSLRTAGYARDATISIAFNADGSVIAGGGTDGTIRLWKTSDGRLIGAFSGHTERVLSVAFSRDGRLLASGSADGTARLWQMPRSLAALKAPTCPSEQVVTAEVDAHARRYVELADAKEDSVNISMAESVASLRAAFGALQAGDYDSGGALTESGRNAMGTALLTMVEIDEGMPRELSALVEALGDPNPVVRGRAADQLRSIAMATAGYDADVFKKVGVLSALRQRLEAETDPSAKDTITRAVGYIAKWLAPSQR